MPEGKVDPEPSLVERWLSDQQQWQRTILTYLDSLIKNDDFLVHIGNAMRGSLLAGKPYPTPAPPGVSATQETPVDDRLDRILFGINQLQGQLQDVLMTLDELKQQGRPLTAPLAATSPEPPREPPRPKRARPAVSRSKNRKRRVRG